MDECKSFKNVSDKALLCGIDSTVITTQHKLGTDSIEYFLSTPEDALFNVNGKIFLKDSIIYFNDKADEFPGDKDSVQILFNFKQKDKYSLAYSRNGISRFITINRQDSRYYEQIEDSVFRFRILKPDNIVSDEEEIFILEVSLKWGVVGLIYWKEGYTFAVDIINQKIIRRKTKFNHGR
jgi:hypothetical protein